jgi:hypothetical protein
MSSIIIRLRELKTRLSARFRPLGKAGVLAWSGRDLGRLRTATPTTRGDRTVSELLLEDRR